MEELQRSTSKDSSASRTSSIHLSSAATTTGSRKGRSVNATSNNHAERASISMPPPPSFSRQAAKRPTAQSFFRGHESLIQSSHITPQSVVQSPRERSMSEDEALGKRSPPPLVDTATNKTYLMPSSNEQQNRPLKFTASDTDSNRHSFSSVRSLGYTSIGAGPSVPSSNGDSEPDESRSDGLAAGTTTATSQVSVTSTGPSTAAFSNGDYGFNPPESISSLPSSLSVSPQQISPSQISKTKPPTRSIDVARTRRSTIPKKTGPGNTSGTVSPMSEKPDPVPKMPSLGIIGICALDSKARSKPSRQILSRINSKQEFEVIIFGDKVILDERPENWPLCDYLISFFSEGFPLDKAIEYVRLRKPFSVNDLPMQKVLWDRRLCLMILDRSEVPTPKRVEVTRDGGPRLSSPEMAQHVFDRTGLRLQGPADGTGGGVPPPQKVFMIDDDTISVDGVELKKPFVEKPVSGEDHNIHIYFPAAEGGGGRRLFRKVNNKSSEADATLKIPRSITEEGHSYIYESFLSTPTNEDVKAYTVGSGYCHVETRKSPVVDGIVKRNTHGKEIRYVTSLTPAEAEIAAKVADAFGQRVCGFDLLRVRDKSYVIDVNGWSFVKDNVEYYDRCAKILKDMFVNEKIRRDGPIYPSIIEDLTTKDSSTRASGGHFASLKSILKVPSMSRLHGHHGKTHSEGSVSPKLIPHTQYMISSPTLDQPGLAKLPLGPTTNAESVASSALPSPEPPIAATEAELLSMEASPEKHAIIPPPATNAQWKLKGMVGVIRHADRTPKQKFKFTFHTKPFIDLLNGHREEVFLIGEAALSSVMDAVQTALAEGIEDIEKLKLLRTSLVKKGGWAGTKVQIKPMFRKQKKDKHVANTSEPQVKKADTKGSDVSHDDSRSRESPEPPLKAERSGSTSLITLSRASAEENNLEIEKLQLIVKWGGEPTHSARYQAQELGEIMRNDLLLMNRDAVDDLAVYSSSERRVTTSAQIWTAAFLDRKEIPPDYIQIRKDLLDDSNAAKDEMDKVKKKLKGLLREGNRAPPQFAWPDNMPEPFIVVRNVVELMKFHRRVMRQNFTRLYGSAAATLAATVKNPNSTTSSLTSSLSQAQAVNEIQGRWCCGEDAELFKERWEKLFAEFQDPEKVDPGKVSELHDTMKFDALHNRAFLEWVFTPSAAILEEMSVETASKEVPKVGSESSRSAPPSRVGTGNKDKDTASGPRGSVSEMQQFAHRVSTGFRRKSEVEESSLRKSAPDASSESYFSLYTGTGTTRTKTDNRLDKLRELFLYSKILFDFIGPQEYGILDSEKLEIGLLTSLPLLRAIVDDLEDMQASEGAKTSIYFTKESHIYTLLNCIIEGGIPTKIQRNKIPELDYLSTICFELYESQNVTHEDEAESFNYSIRITISPGCHTFDPLDVQLDSKHCIGFAPRRSLTAHGDWKQVTETLRAKFDTVKLPKSFLAINLSERITPTPDTKAKSEPIDILRMLPLGQTSTLEGADVLSRMKNPV